MKLKGKTVKTAPPAWMPTYSRWRHGGWYVHNVLYPSGACGCVSNNYPDKKWRIACDDRRNEIGGEGDFTFPSRDAAARAEYELANSQQVVWSDEDSVAASQQGWCVFESVGDTVEIQLQREDEMEVFASDDDAAIFVKAKAAGGDVLAKKAIAYLQQEGSSDVKRFALHEFVGVERHSPSHAN